MSGETTRNIPEFINEITQTIQSFLNLSSPSNTDLPAFIDSLLQNLKQAGIACQIKQKSIADLHASFYSAVEADTVAASYRNTVNLSEVSKTMPIMTDDGMDEFQKIIAQINQATIDSDPLPSLNQNLLALFSKLSSPLSGELKPLISQLIHEWLTLLDLDLYAADRPLAAGTDNRYLTSEFLVQNYPVNYEEIQALANSKLPSTQRLIQDLLAADNWPVLSSLAMKLPQEVLGSFFTQEIIQSLLAAETDALEHQNALLCILKLNSLRGLEPLEDNEANSETNELIKDISLVAHFYQQILDSEMTGQRFLDNFFPNPGQGKNKLKAAAAYVEEFVWHGDMRKMRLNVQSALDSTHKIDAILKYLTDDVKQEGERWTHIQALLSTLYQGALTEPAPASAAPKAAIPDIASEKTPSESRSESEVEESNPEVDGSSEFIGMLEHARFILQSVKTLIQTLHPEGISQRPPLAPPETLLKAIPVTDFTASTNKAAGGAGTGAFNPRDNSFTPTPAGSFVVSSARNPFSLYGDLDL